MRSSHLVLILVLVFLLPVFGEDLTFEAFTDTWEGTISSNSLGGSYNDPIVLMVYSDGYYTDSSGRLMPTLYPNTQLCEFDSETNRVHFWYLKTVYAGQHFYQHFYYEVVTYTGDYLKMHWNYWDDPEPHPDVGTITVTRQGSTALDTGTWGSLKGAFQP